MSASGFSISMLLKPVLEPLLYGIIIVEPITAGLQSLSHSDVPDCEIATVCGVTASLPAPNTYCVSSSNNIRLPLKGTPCLNLATVLAGTVISIVAVSSN